ncbi:uncharacterized protein with von Willebrand factor type A (vWA) domain [Bradyrhizobium japonicum]
MSAEGPAATKAPPPEWAWTLFQQLRRREFAVGPKEFELLREALRAGFGLASRSELRAVCAALWAKSPAERAVVAALFDQLMPDDWTVPAGSLRDEPTPPQPTSRHAPEGMTLEAAAPLPESPPPAEAVAVAATGPRLPPLRLLQDPALLYRHVFLPQYPVSFRAVAQAWRRLRWPVREGPPTELDVAATIARRARAAVVSPPVLRPRRRNRVRVLLFVDRHGSMAPFHAYVDEVCAAITQSGRIGQVTTHYFHDVPLEGAESALRDRLDDVFARLDSVLAEIPPLLDGELYADPDLRKPVSARRVLENAWNAAIVIVSDGGAARGRYDLTRLLDTLAFARGLMGLTRRVVWLNPLPRDRWARSSAAEIARHLPMLPMDREGIHKAVDVLRGHPYTLEQPMPAPALASLAP